MQAASLDAAVRTDAVILGREELSISPFRASDCVGVALEPELLLFVSPMLGNAEVPSDSRIASEGSTRTTSSSVTRLDRSDSRDFDRSML
jgi:hypothetical protein